MRQLLFILISVMPLMSLAQEKFDLQSFADLCKQYNVEFPVEVKNPKITEFMGIPIDGTVEDMAMKLKTKGFQVLSLQDGLLAGEFNGHDVIINLQTNKGKVWRVALGDKDPISDEGNVKIRYNNLVGQFLSNPRYSGDKNQFISEEEHISYELTVNHKQYGAKFYQVSVDESKAEMEKIASHYEQIFSQYSKEQMENPTEELKKDVVDFLRVASAKISEYLQLENRVVWMTILERDYIKYGIVLFYENRLNMANGDDL